ncbi:hypothetical protein EON64_04120 [archaeon]|nr:MAG: hypothetical protein EON64_04120 [archaeon]
MTSPTLDSDGLPLPLSAGALALRGATGGTTTAGGDEEMEGTGEIDAALTTDPVCALAAAPPRLLGLAAWIYSFSYIM